MEIKLMMFVGFIVIVNMWNKLIKNEVIFVVIIL